MKKEIFVFDLDGTLTRGNVSCAFGVHLYRKGYINLFQIAVVASAFFLHALGLISTNVLYKIAFCMIFRRLSLSFVTKEADIFVRDNLEALLRSEAPAWLSEARGNHILLLSTSFDFLVSRVAEYLAARFNISLVAKGTGYRLERGILQEAEVVLDGQQKFDFLIEYMKKKGLLQSHITVYSDSIRDLPLFEAAAVAVVVSPDQRLRKIAQKRSWKIVEA